MSVYNGPSSASFDELKRRVDAQLEQMLSLRADIQELIQLVKMTVVLLGKLVDEPKDDKQA